MIISLLFAIFLHGLFSIFVAAVVGKYRVTYSLSPANLILGLKSFCCFICAGIIRMRVTLLELYLKNNIITTQIIFCYYYVNYY